MIFLQQAQRLCINELFVVISLKSVIKLSHFSLHGLGKRPVFVLNDSKLKDGEMKILVRRVVAKYLRKLEKFRIQSILQVEKLKKKKT